MDDTKNELEKRQKDFLEKYGKLVEETNIDFATYPVYVPDGQGGFKTIIQSTPIDITKKDVPSPFIAKE